MTPRVVLAMESASRRALARLGLDLSGDFDVVGVAVDERDVPLVVERLRPDVLVVDFPRADDGGLGVVAAARRACVTTRAVVYDALVARHCSVAGRSGTLRPIEVALVLKSVLDDRIPAPA